MVEKKQFKFSRLAIATIGFGVLFLALNITQTSCGGGAPQKADSDKANVLVGASNPATGNLLDPVLSGIVPSEVALPPNDTLSFEGNRPYFDHFSWQTFIALCWPVTPGKRGVPLDPTVRDTFLNMTNTTPLVWTSYKNQWELFGQGTNTPSPWNSWDNPTKILSCNPKQVFFGSVNSQHIAGEINESFSVPLIDQNKNYALFEIRYNEPQYNFILDNGLYLNVNLDQYKKKHNGAVTMPTSTASTQGSILVKAAWRQLTPQDDPSRYYVIDDIVYDPITNSCIKQKMGLVGFHIAQKVDSFPQWIWSSFEQVDNVPGAPNAKAPYSFNNGKASPVTQGGYANKPSGQGYVDPSKRVPVQVTRLNEIPTTPVGLSTVDLNKIYQKAVGNTWMQYYQLVITQWPTNPSVFKQFSQNGIYPADCGGAFPVNNCANTTMETYLQSAKDAGRAGGNSCMSCHYTAPDTDFSWSLQLRSH